MSISSQFKEESLKDFPTYLPKLLDEHLPAWIETRKNSKKIDPYDDYTWQGVLMGWAIGKGMTYAQARVFTRYVYWKTDY